MKEKKIMQNIDPSKVTMNLKTHKSLQSYEN